MWSVNRLIGRASASSCRGCQGYLEEGKVPPRLAALITQDVGLMVLDLVTSQGNQDKVGHRSIAGRGPGT